MSQPIHQEITFDATPDQVYAAYMNPAQRAQYTEGEVEISADEGGAFSCHGGQIVGRNLELIPGQRIVQAWRVHAWPPGLYTTVHFELAEGEGGTRLVMDHYGVPDDFEKHIADGWHARYWGPMREFFGAST